MSARGAVSARLEQREELYSGERDGYDVPESDASSRNHLSKLLSGLASYAAQFKHVGASSPDEVQSCSISNRMDFGVFCFACRKQILDRF